MTITISTPQGVHRIRTAPGTLAKPIEVRAASLSVAVTCARSIVAEERRKAMQAFDDIDAALAALTASPPVDATQARE